MATLKRMAKKSAKKLPTRSTKVSPHGLVGQLPDAPAADRNLWIALGISLLFHALLLSLHFTFPDASRAFQEKALDIILVNSKSARKPTDAQALAQANLDGGGQADKGRATAALRAERAEIFALARRGRLADDVARRLVREIDWPVHSLLVNVRRGEEEILPQGTFPSAFFRLFFF